MVWLLPVICITILAFIALWSYLSFARRKGNCVLIAHSLILLIALSLASVGVVILKFVLI